MISNAEDYINSIIGKKIKIKKSEININSEKLVKEDIIKFAKLELAMIYYHCLETFIRLFVAHASLSECPWIDLSRLDFKKYKSVIENLSRNNFESLNKFLKTNETILFVLTGINKIPNEVSVEDVEGLRNWIVWSAEQLLTVYDYNAFKHGLAISPKYGGIKILDDKKVKIEAHGETIEFISRIKKETRYVWSRETILIPYDSRSAIIYTISKMIQNIMIIGKALHFKESCKLEWLPSKDWSPEFIFKNNENSFLRIEGFKIELLYYKN